MKPERWPGAVDVSIVASVGVAMGLMLLTYRTTAVINRAPDVRVTWAVAAFALAAGARRPWWPWAHWVWAAVAAGTLGEVWLILIAPDPIPLAQTLQYVAESLAPFLVIVILGSSWNLLAAGLRKGIARPLALVAAVNVLNLADALLTRFAVESGGAQELNPFVRALGGGRAQLAVVQAAPSRPGVADRGLALGALLPRQRHRGEPLGAPSRSPRLPCCTKTASMVKA